MNARAVASGVTLSSLMLLVSSCTAPTPAACPTRGAGSEPPSACETQSKEVVGAASAGLPSWRDGYSKRAIVEFVEKVVDSQGASFVPESARIAVFDNDGTLWTEKPLYIQALFAMDIVRELAAAHPEWTDEQPFKAVLEGDMEALSQAGEEGLLKMVMATHSDLTEAEFAQRVRDWLRVAQHPTLNRPYRELVYQPMLELLSYLRENQFKVFIVSGGGISFMRVFAEEIYGVPAERVIGSEMAIRYEYVNEKPVIVRDAQLNFVNDKEGKPLGIQRRIGIRPVMAFGNSDGDLQMLEWTTAGTGARFGGLVKHTDGEREFLYDKDSSVGRLDKAEKRALKDGWLVVDMKRDWKQVFPAPSLTDSSSSGVPQH